MRVWRSLISAWRLIGACGGRTPPGKQPRLYRRALALDPTSVDGHWRFGRFLYIHGRFEDGEAEIRKALTLDPLSVQANFQLECVKYYRRDYHAAIAQGRRTLELDQRYAWAHHVLGLALEAEHEYDEAFVEFEKSQRGPSGNLGHAYAVAGRRAEALKILDQLKSRYEREGVGPGSVAQVYIGLGEFDRALEWLNTAIADGSEFLTLGIAPLYDPLRSDLRFEELLRRSGLID